MAVYKFRTMDLLYAAVRKVAHNLIGDFNVTLSGPEFVSAFIKPEHVEPLRQTQDIVGLVGDLSTYSKFDTSDGIQTELILRFARNEPPIILPRYVCKGVVKTAPEDTVAKLRAYVDERVRLGRLFGDALDTLRYINDNCGNASAMNIMFPVLPALMVYADPDSSSDSTFAKRANKLVSAKSFGTLPKLPRQVTSRMLEASNVVQTGLMLEAPTSALASKSERGDAIITVNRLGDGVSDFIYEALGQKMAASFV